MFASTPGVPILINAGHCIAEQIIGSYQTVRLPELSGSHTFSRGSGKLPARGNQIVFHSLAWLTMSYGKHGRFDDTCQDKRPRIKKRHPCRFKINRWPPMWNAPVRTGRGPFRDLCIFHSAKFKLTWSEDWRSARTNLPTRADQTIVPVRVLELGLQELLPQGEQVHQQRLARLLLEQRLVQLFHKHRLHNQCSRRMKNHSLVLFRSRLERLHSTMGLVRSRLALPYSILRGLACTSELCT